MKTKKLSEFTLDELYQKKKLLKGILIGFTTIMLLAFSVLLYLISKGQNLGLIAVIPACLVTLLPNLINLNQINKEIKSRELN